MNSLLISPETNKPKVTFSESGVLSITGRSIPEHPIKFYKPISDWLEEFIATSPIKIHLTIYFDYLNTHSTECIVTLVKMLDDYYQQSKSDVTVVWNFENGDEDMESLGLDIKSFVGLPFIVEDSPI